MENETVPVDYQKGFNEGYIMKKHLPELSDKLVDRIGQSVRSEGFKDGRQEAILEKSKERYPGWLKSNRLSTLDSKDKPKDKEIDRDDHER